MADVKISALPAATTPLVGTEVLPIVQNGVTDKVSVANLTAGRAVSATQYTSTIATGTAPLIVASTTEVANLKAATATLADSATSANAVKSNATTGVLQVTGPAAASTRVMTTPDANFTVARTDAAQTFTGNQIISGNVIIGTATQVNSSQFQTKDNCVIATDTAAVSRQYDISKYSAALTNNTALDLFVVSRASASGYTQASVLTGTLYISIQWGDTGGGQSTHSYSAPIGIGSTNSNNLTFNIGTPYDFRVRNGGASADTITIDVSPASTTSTTIRITASSATYPISSGVVSARFIGVGCGNDANRMLSVVPA